MDGTPLSLCVTSKVPTDPPRPHRRPIHHLRKLEKGNGDLNLSHSIERKMNVIHRVVTEFAFSGFKKNHLMKEETEMVCGCAWLVKFLATLGE
jgi:hypothetical protein